MLIDAFTIYCKNNELYKFRLGVYQKIFPIYIFLTFDYNASPMQAQIHTL